jgi:hypothetical protein
MKKNKINTFFGRKTNIFLIVSVLVLSFILIAEVYYIFFSQNKEVLTDDLITIKNTNPQTKNISPSLIDSLRKKSSQSTNLLFTDIQSQIGKVKPLYQSGVLKEMIITETYESEIQEIGDKQESIVAIDGTTMNYSFILSFLSFSESGEKQIKYLFTNSEVPRIKAFQLMKGEEKPIELNKINNGDRVSISITIDALMNPQDNLISLKIVKLL